MSTYYKIDDAKQYEYATQNNWILFPDEFPCPNLAKKVSLDTDIMLRRPPVFIEMSHEFWHKHFKQFTLADLKARCASLGVTARGRSKEAHIEALIIYFRRLIKA